MKKKIIHILKTEMSYVSGQKISEELGVTRSMVWKVINGLREEGYEIDSVTNKGYHLVSVPDLVTEEEIQSVLDTKVFGKVIYSYEEVASTNEIAKAKAREGAKEGTVFIAESQTKGRGRLGKAWESPGGTGIWMSVVVRPNILPQDVSAITLITGLAVCKAIRETTQLPAYIKWPNDIVVNGKKVCGILTEMSAEIDRVNYVIIGIGINVNTATFPEELEEIGTSLKIESHKDYKRGDLAAKVLMALEKYYDLYKKNKSLLPVIDEYKKLCITLKNEVFIVDNKEAYRADPVGIDPAGALIVNKKDGTKTVIQSGEVSVRGVCGYV